MAKPKQTFNWMFSQVVENATMQQMDRILKAFIAAVEKEKLFCGGGFHALNFPRESVKPGKEKTSKPAR